MGKLAAIGVGLGINRKLAPLLQNRLVRNEQPGGTGPERIYLDQIDGR